MSEQEIIAVEGKVSGERCARVFFQRKVVHDLMSQLNPTLQDAMIEIAIAPQLDENPGFYRMMNYGRVSSMRPDDLNDYQIRIRKTYQEWRARLYRDSQMALSVATRICQNEDSVKQVCLAERIGHKTCIRLLQYALNEYAILSGWGNQING